MALEGPRTMYTRFEEESPLDRALRLAREVEELLEDNSSARIACALAASLVDELKTLDHAAKKPRLC